MPDEGNYWEIRVRSDEWLFSVHTLVKRAAHRFKSDDEEPPAMMSFDAQGYPSFFVSRSYISAEEIAAMFGQTPMAVRAARCITLLPLAPGAKVPEPNVPYYGTA